MMELDVLATGMTAPGQLQRFGGIAPAHSETEQRFNLGLQVEPSGPSAAVIEPITRRTRRLGFQFWYLILRQPSAGRINWKNASRTEKDWVVW